MVNFSALKQFDKVSAGFSGIWLVFLGYPLSYLIASDATTDSQQIIGILCIIVFALIYVLSFGTEHLLKEPVPLKRTLYWNLLLLIPTIALAFVLGPWALCFSTYFVAMWCYRDPRIAGIVIGSCLALLNAISTYLMFPQVFSNGGFGFVIGSVFVIVMAVLVAWSDIRRAKNQELAQAKQAESIARDVHDILGHSLTVINLKAELAAALATAQPEKAIDEMNAVSELSRNALAEVRATVTRMKTPNFSGELEASSRALETARITQHLPAPEEARIVGNNATLFSWVLREGITNVVRHSKAKNCWVRLEPERIEIVDDGLSGTITPGNGLNGLRDRVKEAGGDFLLETGVTTRLLVTMNGKFDPLEFGVEHR